jgi:hypothetical protein
MAKHDLFAADLRCFDRETLNAELEAALAKTRARKPRRPSVATLMQQAQKTGANVEIDSCTGNITISGAPNGTTEDIITNNPWDEVYRGKH